MANEISATTTLTATKAGGTVTGSNTKTITLAGNALFEQNQILDATGVAVYFGVAIVAEGVSYYLVKNLDASIYVELGKTNFGNIFAKLLPGQSCLIPVNAAAATNPTIYARAASGTPYIQVVAVGT